MMKSRLKAILCFVGFAAAIAAARPACTNADQCPAKESIVPGAACGGGAGQCAYDLTVPNAACDGTTSVIATSCACVDGAWACPTAGECPAVGGADAAAEAADDGG